MKSEDILVGIVLLNADINRVVANIQLIEPNVKQILLIDNGSDDHAIIHEKSKNFSKVAIMQNNENKGIAYALNQILTYGNNNNYRWVMTLDQDSVPDSNMIPHMIETANESIGMVVPRLVDKNIGKTIKNGQAADDTLLPPREVIKNPKDIMTSGCLMNMKMVEQVGLFEEKLFIDYVDIDYNERILRKGYTIVRDNRAVLHHELGKSEIRHFFGHDVLVDNHSAFRRYYMTRNRLYIAKKYYGTKGYTKEYLKVLLSKGKIILFEEDKKEKLQAIKKGIKDVRTL